MAAPLSPPVGARTRAQARRPNDATLRVYVGQTRSRKLIAQLNGLGFGECTNRGETPPRRRPWCLDNGAYSDWRSGRAFNAEEFWSDLTSPVVVSDPPDFIVCPDRVATGLESLAFSLHWHDRCESARPGQRYYLAVQDGMTEADVAPVARRFAGIFVGGTLAWKIKTGAHWVAFAHAQRMRAHVGRVGTARRVRWARRIGADSIDSCLPLWSAKNLATFVRALDPPQTEMPW